MAQTIYLSGDHAGFYDKEKIKTFLEQKGLIVVDFGPSIYKKDDDYPDFVIPMAKQVAKAKAMGIIIAGSGVGETIATNKIKGIRAVNFQGGSAKIIRTSREHDNANVLCMGSRFLTLNEMKRAINAFLSSKFQRGRHQRRLNKITKMTHL